MNWHLHSKVINQSLKMLQMHYRMYSKTLRLTLREASMISFKKRGRLWWSQTLLNNKTFLLISLWSKRHLSRNQLKRWAPSQPQPIEMTRKLKWTKKMISCYKFQAQQLLHPRLWCHHQQGAAETDTSLSAKRIADWATAVAKVVHCQAEQAHMVGEARDHRKDPSKRMR